MLAAIALSVLVSCQTPEAQPQSAEAAKPERTFEAGGARDRYGREQWYHIAFSLDAKTLVTGSFLGHTRVWDTTTGELIRTLDTDGIFRGVSPNGRTVASVDKHKGCLELWDTSTGQKRQTSITGQFVHLGTNAIPSVAFSPDGKVLATADHGRGLVNLWDAVTLKSLGTTPGLRASPNHLAFSPDGKLLAGTGFTVSDPSPKRERVSQCRLAMWDVKALREVCTFKWQGGYQSYSPGQNPTQAASIRSVEFSPDGTILTAGRSIGGSVRIWDIAKRKVVRTLDLNGDTAFSVACSSDGKLIATGHESGRVALWDAATGSRIRLLEWHTKPVGSVVFVPDDKKLITAGMERYVAIWRVDSE